jgi:hypothetical protein
VKGSKRERGGQGKRGKGRKGEREKGRKGESEIDKPFFVNARYEFLLKKNKHKCQHAREGPVATPAHPKRGWGTVSCQRTNWPNSEYLGRRSWRGGRHSYNSTVHLTSACLCRRKRCTHTTTHTHIYIYIYIYIYIRIYLCMYVCICIFIFTYIYYIYIYI